MPDEQQKPLEQLKAESEDWQRTERPKGYYFHECPNWIEEHNRRVEIQRQSAQQCSFTDWHPESDF